MICKYVYVYHASILYVYTNIYIEENIYSVSEMDL